MQTKRPPRRRSYTDATIKVLFAMSGNRCAAPDCVNPIVAQGTALSPAAVLGQMCHVYASSDAGPRGRTDLDERERNEPANLILLCGHHHPLVDRQHETFPADLLLEWKRVHEAKHQPGSPEYGRLEGSIRQAAFAAAKADDEVARAVDRLRRGRGFAGFASRDEAVVLASRVHDGELAGASASVRAKALAWCARTISRSEPDQSRVFLERARGLGAGVEIRIAEAALASRSDEGAALAVLASMKTAAVRTAALRIVRLGRSARDTLAWVAATGISEDFLDAEGRSILLSSELEACLWQAAADRARDLHAGDFEDFPALLHLAAIAFLLTVVPEPLRAAVRSQVPFDPAGLPFAADDAAMDARGRACDLFGRAGAAARDLGVADAVDEDYALWLRLRDPREGSRAREALSASLRDPEGPLRHVRFALAFGIPLDLAMVERRIDARAALAGGDDVDGIVARFCLALASPDAGRTLDALARHGDRFREFLMPDAVDAVEIEAMARSGMRRAAGARLGELVAAGLGEAEAGRLRVMLAEAGDVEADGEGSVARRLRQYETTDALPDLALLVEALERAGSWRELRIFAERLFAATGSLPDGVRLARVHDWLGERGLLLAHLKANAFILAHSQEARTYRAWAFFGEGRLAEARGAVGGCPPDGNARALRVNIAIASGDWEDVAAFCEEQWDARSERGADELMRAANLARTVGSARAPGLAAAAADAAPEDAGILAAAYFDAVRAGAENEVSARWLSRAAALSGEDGPLRSVSLEELAGMKPGWDELARDAWRRLRAGDVPQGFAATLVGRPLTDLTLLPALANPGEQEPRRRAVIHAFAGSRRPAAPRPPPSSLVLDVTAMLTLARLGVLDEVVDSYGRITVAHGMIAWLFEERRRAEFHQPDRLVLARAVRDLLARGRLGIAGAQTGDAGLAKEVGDDLSDLAAAARRADPSTGARVVRAPPIHRPGSLILEEAGTSDLADLLCDCGAVVTRLRRSGVLSAGDERRARDALRLRERPWPDGVEVPEGALLCLDAISVDRLRAAGVLDELAASPHGLVVNEGFAEDCRLLLAYEALTARRSSILEATRRTLRDAIATGRVCVAPMAASRARRDDASDPTLELFAAAADADVLVTDDRFLNRHPRAEVDGRTIPVITSLDLLEDLTGRGVVAADRLIELRTLLRRSGYQLMPVDAAELPGLLEAAHGADGTFAETAELAALRQSIGQACSSRVLRLPDEASWLRDAVTAIDAAIKAVWGSDVGVDAARDRCDWLAGLIDARAFAPSMPGNAAVEVATDMDELRMMRMMTPPEGIGADRRDDYHAWLDDRVLGELEDGSPEVFARLVSRVRDLVAGVASATAEGSAVAPELRRRRALSVALAFPARIRAAVAASSDMKAGYGLRTDATMVFDASASFRRTALADAVRALRPDATGTVSDLSGVAWTLSVASVGDAVAVSLAADGHRYLSTHLALLLDDREARLRAFDRECERVRLPGRATGAWRASVGTRPLDDETLTLLMEDLADAPVAFGERLAGALVAGGCSVGDIVPRSLRHYERLVGPCSDEAGLADYLRDGAAPLIRELLAWRRVEGARLALLLGSHPDASAMVGAQAFAAVGEMRALLDWTIATGDELSRTAAIEGAFGVSPVDPEDRRSLAEATRAMLGSEASGFATRFESLSALALLVLDVTARRRTFAAKPPFWHRAAALAQASLIERTLRSVGVDVEDFVSRIPSAGESWFLAKSLVDLRREPRGLAAVFTAEQMRNEFGFRLLASASGAEDLMAELDLIGLLGVEGSLARGIDMMLGGLPGPLEGGIAPGRDLPPGDEAAFRAALEADEIGLETFVVAGLHFHFDFPDDLALRVAEALGRSGLRLETDGDRSRYVATLASLASLAAVTRCSLLQDAVQAVVLRDRASEPAALTLADAMTVGLTACASCPSLGEWCGAVGSFLERLADRTSRPPEIRWLHARLGELCHLVPGLWASCGHVEAGLKG